MKAPNYLIPGACVDGVLGEGFNPGDLQKEAMAAFWLTIPYSLTLISLLSHITEAVYLHYSSDLLLHLDQRIYEHTRTHTYTHTLLFIDTNIQKLTHNHLPLCHTQTAAVTQAAQAQAQAHKPAIITSVLDK